MSGSLKALVAELSRRGPNKVFGGDLAFAGLPGLVCTPESGFSLPAVAFGHGWLTQAAAYEGLLKHLASWGIVAAAPATERGVVPSHQGLAIDLRTTLDICAGVRLGPGKISVHPDKLALAGHGMGASCAVLAASGRSDIAAVAALFPVTTSPHAVDFAPQISAPGLIVATPTDNKKIDPYARSLALTWGGDVQLRALAKGTGASIPEGRTVMAALGVDKPDKKVRRTLYAVLTGYILATAGNKKEYAAFAELDKTAPLMRAIDPFVPEQVKPSMLARAAGMFS
ncbi:chlorophyllase/cutinase-like alpha/beta fold protein [Smaragdicoccus niigatensis]|uniref:poly(ethylene terephthalate) hydrolase family protein n=1 Tax=Smaragdicoccus niigatensis TaxID=359359 RepID=UPI00035EF136|nr:alpha/beta hydrolase [Smaragdicoccus niigatensis]